MREAEFMLTASPPFTRDVFFHSQQLAEKSFKALLAWHNQPFRKTHNLTEIGQQCVAIDPALAQIAKQASTLSDYAWRYRYPGEPNDPTEAEARAALATAREVYESILVRLPPDIRP
jgi:HEPN domain-containing protein